MLIKYVKDNFKKLRPKKTKVKNPGAAAVKPYGGQEEE